MKKSLVLLSAVGLLLAYCSAAPAQPAATGYTVDDVYYYLVKGIEATWGGHDLEPPAGAVPGVITGKTLDEIYTDLASLYAQAVAGPGDVLEGVAFWSTDTAAWGVQTGTIATQTLSDANDTVAAGYYAATTLSAVDADLATANIKSGETIFGVAGDPNVVDTSSGDAAAGDLLDGKKAWADGAEVTGTIATQTLSADNDTVAAGYYAATTLSAVDADLATANIKSGETIFGVAGDPNVVDTSSGDAAAGDLLDGKKAWADGAEVTGTIATQTLSADNDTVAAGYYAATTLSAVDADLATANIKSGETIFGVAGDPNVVDTSSGDAAAGDLLDGKKAWADGAEVTGTIATQTLSDANDTVAAGYYAATTLSAVDADLATANVKSGVTVFGVAGDPNVVDTSSGDAVAGDLLDGKKAWADGAEVTGTIATRTLSDANDTVAAGYYAATTLSAVDADLATANIKSGETIFGVAGDPNVVDTSSGDAAAGDLLDGKKAWADGAEVTGTIATQTLSDANDTVAAGYYAATTLSAVDADLATANVKSGVTVFGVAGDPNVVDTSSGDAVAGDLLDGKKAWADGAEVTGTIATQTLSDANDTVAGGYYAATTLSAVDADLATANVKSGVTVFGVAGDPNVVDTSSGDAVAGDLMDGKKAWADGAEVTGTIATQTLSDANDTVAAGYYAATTLSAVDADLATANVKSGETIFGVAGDPNVVDTSSGDAAAGDLLDGKKAWVDGAEVTGTIATQTLSADNDTVAAGYYAATTLSAVDPDLATANIKSGETIFGVAGDPNVVDTSSGDAAAGDIKSGKKAWADGAEVTGTITTRTLSAASQTVSAGFYEETTLSGVDADLAAGNIKSGTTIFGVAGSYSGSGGGLLKTGQTTSYRSGDDGTYQKGTAFSYQTLDPAANGEIVTTDNVTGLMWAADGSGKGCNWGSQTTWNEAIDWAEGLTFAGYSDWRLPNATEIWSLVVCDATQSAPYINQTYFPNTVFGFYWSSTSRPDSTSSALLAFFGSGYLYPYSKTFTYYVRAVRGGE